MTSTIQKVCCCDGDAEYVQFKLPPRCSDNDAIGCDCDSDEPYEWRTDQHGCGAVDPRNYECSATGETDCPAPDSGDCTSCGAVYLDKNEYKNLAIHTCDGITWSPNHELVEFMDAWFQAGGGSYTQQLCLGDDPSTIRATIWADSAPCNTQTNLVKEETDVCFAPVVLENSDARNPLSSGTVLSTEKVDDESTTRPLAMTAGNITELNVGTGDAWFAAVFRVQSGATTGRRRIFDQGDDNFGLILDGTTLKACFGSETNSAQESNLDTGEWHIVVAQRQSGTITARLTGSAFGTNNVSSSDSINTSDQFKINTTGTGDVNFRGQYGDIVVGDGTISQDFVEKFEWYLANKFDLIGSLPSSHPYKTTTPTVTNLTPKEFTSRLANHIFKINLDGRVVPCLLSGGGCLGPQEYSIGADCKVIEASDIKRDCANNVMFYGPSHPNSINHIPINPLNFPNGGFEFACYQRFWVDNLPCEASQTCPDTCDDRNDPFLEEKNLVQSEWAKGIHYIDCDDCDSCNPLDGTGKVLVTDRSSCNGSRFFSPLEEVIWQDPFNALYGVTNYTNQNRCSDEFLANDPDDCCVNPGDRNSPFLGVIDGDVVTQCETSCSFIDINGNFVTNTFDAPFENCIEARAIESGFCNPSGSANCFCALDGQPKVTALTVNFGTFSTTDCQTPSDCLLPRISVFACGSTCALSSGGTDQHICAEDRTGTQGRCGVVVSTADPTEFDPIRCCTACQDPPGGVSCAGQGVTSCAEIGYEGVTGGLDTTGIGVVNGGSIVIDALAASGAGGLLYRKQGVGSDRGLIISTSHSVESVTNACDEVACSQGLNSCGCPPQNLACEGSGYTPMKNGVTEVELLCLQDGANLPLPLDTEYRYLVEITLKWGTTEPDGEYPNGAGTATFTYDKLSQSFDPRGTYSFRSSTRSSGVSYPSTITVT